METLRELSTQNLWETVQSVLKEQLSAPSFETWIAPLKLLEAEKAQIRLETTSAFNRDWILRHYREALSMAFAAVLELPVPPAVSLDVQAVVEPEPEKLPGDDTADPMSGGMEKRACWTPRTVQSQLNPKYTFDQFVVGNHSRFCHAAALAVAETPAQSYNPLFIYGGVGLGKTHLMQAIGHFVHQHHPDLKVKYVTAEQFTNDLISALGSHDMKNFRDRYRRMNILLIDDIQFLEGKDRTQEEIFHTFNALHQSGKQIVISSDRPPDRLSRLEDRLRSRFSWGLIADIQPADFETRMAILQRKAHQLNLSLSDEVTQYIAESFPANIRELEGALNKVAAYRMLVNGHLDLGQVQTLLGKRFDPSRLSHEDMLDAVARYYHMQRADIQSPLRTRHIAVARQVAIYIIRELTEASFPQIGQLIGGRRHTTILYAYEKMKELLEADSSLRQQVQEIMDTLKSRGSR